MNDAIVLIQTSVYMPFILWCMCPLSERELYSVHWTLNALMERINLMEIPAFFNQIYWLNGDAVALFNFFVRLFRYFVIILYDTTQQSTTHA